MFVSSTLPEDRPEEDSVCAYSMLMSTLSWVIAKSLRGIVYIIIVLVQQPVCMFSGFIHVFVYDPSHRPQATIRYISFNHWLYILNWFNALKWHEYKIIQYVISCGCGTYAVLKFFISTDNLGREERAILFACCWTLVARGPAAPPLHFPLVKGTKHPLVSYCPHMTYNISIIDHLWRQKTCWEHHNVSWQAFIPNLLIFQTFSLF